jgi:microcystin degradation protein MlrC
VLSDPADATGAGSAGDSAHVIGRLLATEPDRMCIACLVAPRAVAAAHEAGTGATITTEIGAQVDPRWTEPVTITAFVRTLSSGHFRYRGGKSRGLEVSMGRAAVLQVGEVFILAMERPAETFDPGMYEAVGLPPQRAAVVLVRSANQFRDSYRSIAADTLMLDAPGPSTARLERLPWRKVRRPIHPLDDIDRVEVATVVGPDRVSTR